MAEMHDGSRSASDNLGLRALLYASEGMDAGDAAAFEALLAGDQLAREALCQAVEFLQRWDAAVPSQPDAAYRQRVRERLLHGDVRRWWAKERTPRGYAVMAAVGALAATVFVVVCLARISSPTEKAAPQIGSAVRHEEPVEEAAATMSPDELEIWADLPRSRHLLKVHHEESERKRRSELHMRVVLQTGIGAPVIAKNDAAN
jgi:hypothetical protein